LQSQDIEQCESTESAEDSGLWHCAHEFRELWVAATCCGLSVGGILQDSRLDDSASLISHVVDCVRRVQMRNES
jgi:hypothetical protein